MNNCPQEYKRELFIRFYLEHFNISKAYRMAGFKADEGNAYRYFHRQDVQKAIEEYTSKELKKLDISVGRTFKHLAAIGYGNPLEVIDYQDKSVRFKELNELPPWVAVTIRKIKKTERATEYTFESKIAALTMLLKYHLEINKKYPPIVKAAYK